MAYSPKKAARHDADEAERAHLLEEQGGGNTYPVSTPAGSPVSGLQQPASGFEDPQVADTVAAAAHGDGVSGGPGSQIRNSLQEIANPENLKSDEQKQRESARKSAAPGEDKQWDNIALGIFENAVFVLVMFLVADVGKGVFEPFARGTLANSGVIGVLNACINLSVAMFVSWYMCGAAGVNEALRVDKILQYAVPSALFAGGQLLSLMANKLIDGAMKKVVNQARIPMTAFLSTILMGAQYTGLQWMGIGVILCSVCGFQVLTKGSIGGGSWGGIIDSPKGDRRRALGRDMLVLTRRAGARRGVGNVSSLFLGFSRVGPELTAMIH